MSPKSCSSVRHEEVDIDLFELNEAFASVVLRYIQAFEIDNAKINVNGAPSRSAIRWAPRAR